MESRDCLKQSTCSKVGKSSHRVWEVDDYIEYLLGSMDRIEGRFPEEGSNAPEIAQRFVDMKIKPRTNTLQHYSCRFSYIQYQHSAFRTIERGHTTGCIPCIDVQHPRNDSIRHPCPQIIQHWFLPLSFATLQNVPLDKFIPHTRNDTLIAINQP